MTWSLANIEQLSVRGTSALGVSAHLEINQGNSNDKYQLYYTGDGGVTVIVCLLILSLLSRE